MDKKVRKGGVNQAAQKQAGLCAVRNLFRIAKRDVADQRVAEAGLLVPVGMTAEPQRGLMRPDPGVQIRREERRQQARRSRYGGAR